MPAHPMTSKERVLAAVAHAPVDRVPFDFQATPTVLERLYTHFGVGTYPALMAVMGIDIVDIRGRVDPIWRGPFPQQQEVAPGVMQNHLGWQLTTVETSFGEERAHCGFIFEEAQRVAEIDAFPWPEASWFDFSGLAEALTPYADKAVMASGASVLQHPMLVRPMEKVMIDMMMQPELAAALMDHYVDFYLEYFDAMFTAAPGRIDLLRIADDLGTQEAPLISPALFEQYVAPRLQQITDMAHRHGVKVLFHSCGAISSFIEALIAIGIDVLDPLQPRAKGMAFDGLLARFGGRIALHGAIDTQYTLPRGSAAEVAREAVGRLELAGRGGGYILAPAHEVQPDVPLENILELARVMQAQGR